MSHNTIACNHPGARVHVVPEGVLLVSPGIFMDYVTANPNGADSWERIQRRFLKWGLHERTAEDLNMHSYPVTGSHRQTVIKGVLIKDPTIVFGDRIPSPNPHLIQGSPASKSHRAGQMLRKGTETLLSPG